ncbi:hypothetical protein [Sphingomonas sp. dw_22]|uniref:hypothetical protein n=1 Tax=Sphingomonas sp. dw_22 TaxID=2721175 RepID=UPI001BD28A48|nr:hypothetical protein [Sphingomonas sp. dw_22]
MRLTRGLLFGVAMIVSVPVQAAQGERAARFDIPAQGLAGALDQFARQAGVQILYPHKYHRHSPTLGRRERGPVVGCTQAVP